jgi:hypothetical protein
MHVEIVRNAEIPSEKSIRVLTIIFHSLRVICCWKGGTEKQWIKCNEKEFRVEKERNEREKNSFSTWNKVFHSNIKQLAAAAAEKNSQRVKKYYNLNE